MKRFNLLGVDVNITNMKETINQIESNLDNVRGKYICVSNVHTIIMSYEDKNYLKIQNESYMTLPDGKPLSVIGKIRGHGEIERVTGPDLMEKIFEISEKKGYTHYFYGSTEETLKKLKINIYNKYPNLKIVGMYSPPFKDLIKDEDDNIIKLINKKKSDFVWVGLGAPKQEIWMYNHKNKLQSLMIGVGAGFDYHAGKIRRAPKWMQNVSLEWLYRLIQDPKRLLKRYIITNSKFIYLLFIHK